MGQSGSYGVHDGIPMQRIFFETSNGCQQPRIHVDRQIFDWEMIDGIEHKEKQYYMHVRTICLIYYYK
jgi:hypothetical protein